MKFPIAFALLLGACEPPRVDDSLELAAPASEGTAVPRSTWTFRGRLVDAYGESCEAAIILEISYPHDLAVGSKFFSGDLACESRVGGLICRRGDPSGTNDWLFFYPDHESGQILLDSYHFEDGLRLMWACEYRADSRMTGSKL